MTEKALVPSEGATGERARPHKHAWQYAYAPARDDVRGLRQRDLAVRRCDACGWQQTLVPLQQGFGVRAAVWADEKYVSHRPAPPSFDPSFRWVGPPPVDEVPGDDARDAR